MFKNSSVSHLPATFSHLSRRCTLKPTWKTSPHEFFTQTYVFSTFFSKKISKSSGWNENPLRYVRTLIHISLHAPINGRYSLQDLTHSSPEPKIWRVLDTWWWRKSACKLRILAFCRIHRCSINIGFGRNSMILNLQVLVLPHQVSKTLQIFGSGELYVSSWTM